jgi:hypothetical protein
VIDATRPLAEVTARTLAIVGDYLGRPLALSGG